MLLTQEQVNISQKACEEKVFLSGFASSGKSTTGKAYLKSLLAKNISGKRILILVPQKSLGLTYQDFLSNLDEGYSNHPVIQTMSGISQKIIRLFWPIIAPQFSFSSGKHPPTFLNIESSQYFLAKICEPYFENNYFVTIRAEKPRILSQILDNLNKSAVVGFPHEEIADRLKSAWNQEIKHLVAYDEAQTCANAFRDYCYQFNLLDFSLQFEVFNQIINSSFLVRQYLYSQYDFLLYDNCEEDTPVSHDVILNWLPNFKGALVIYDQEAGYRSFLGADPISAKRLAQQCNISFESRASFNQDEELAKVISLYNKAIFREKMPPIRKPVIEKINFQHNKFFPDMINKIVADIEALTQTGINPGEIAILAPFVSNSLRFQIQQRLEQKNIKIVSHRPSRSLREEPITHGLITWIKLAFPEWGFAPSIYQFRTAIHQALGELDPIRADLFARIVLSRKDEFLLRPADDLQPMMLERLTLQTVIQYQQIYIWLLNFQQKKTEMDVFLASFFGEILSQPGFGFHHNYEGAEITGKLIESMQNFRTNTKFHFQQPEDNWAIDYIKMVENGLISALYLQTWESPPEDAVYLAPAHTFLMQNRSVKYQFWLDIGNLGWWQRLMQPLTQPYVLSRNWKDEMKWTDLNEYEHNQKNLAKLVSGLIRRCSGKISLFTTSYNENGEEQAGPLLKATQTILRAYQHSGGPNV